MSWKHVQAGHRALAALASLITLSVGTLAFVPLHETHDADEATDAGGAGPLAPGCALQTFGSHQYRTCQVGHPAETAIAAAPNGAVWALSDLRPQRSTDGGQTWTSLTLPLPGTADVIVVAEGDIAVAPNGDVIVTWLTAQWPQTAPVWVSTNGGTSFTYRAASPPNPAPDRPWVMTSATTPADPSNPLQPNPYAILMEAGTGAKLHYVSGDRGNTWYHNMDLTVNTINPTTSYPTGVTNAFLDYTKPLGQGFPVKYLSLANGQVLNVQSRRVSYDLVHWFSLTNTTGWPSTTHEWWDAAADGTLYAVRIASVGGTWTVSYKWYDGVSWNNGATTVPLTAQPDYLIGLQPTHVINAAVKSHGSTLGINTREGTNDVLIRITNANTPSASATKERIGSGSGNRYDFPNLVFDTQGRAVTTYNSAFVAYAQTV